jgi:hypothetical protein
MTNNKQQTAVDIIYQGMSDKIVMQDLNKALICIHISHDDFLKLHKQAEEMEKELMKGMYVEGSFAKMRYYDGLEYIDADQYYEQIYGGNDL